MKYRYLFLLLAFTSSISCDKLGSDGERLPVKVISSISYGTKVSYQQKGDVLHPEWELNDTISIYYKGNTYYYLASEIDEETVFSPLDESNLLPTIENGELVYACYPKVEISDNTVYIQNFDNNFHFRTNKLLPFNYMRGIGVCKNGVLKFEFKLIYSYIKLMITRDFRGITGENHYSLMLDSPKIPFQANVPYHLNTESFGKVSDGWSLHHSDYFFLGSKNEPYVKPDTEFLYFAVEPGVYEDLSISIYEADNPLYQANSFEFTPNTIYVLDPVMKTLAPEVGSFNDMPIIDL